MSITLTCPVCNDYQVEANSTGKYEMPNWQTTKITCEKCHATFSADLHPKLRNDLIQAILADKGARIVKLIGEITGCGLKSAFTVHHAFREAISERPKFPYFAKTRDGKDVVILRTEERQHFPLVGIIIDEENNTMRTVVWTIEGHFLVSKEENPNDLVKE